MFQDEEDSLKVDHFEIYDWLEYNFEDIERARKFHKTISEIWEMIPKDTIVCILCKDGIKRSGIFLTLSNLLYR